MHVHISTRVDQLATFKVKSIMFLLALTHTLTHVCREIAESRQPVILIGSVADRYILCLCSINLWVQRCNVS